METGKRQAKRSFAILLLIVLIGGICGTAFAEPSLIYVDVNATGANNGSTWTDAYKYLQDALTAAGSGSEIWVAQGTYKPDASTSNPGGTGDRAATFQLKNGVAIYGGFPTGGGSRNPNTYVASLNGDIGVPDNNSDNSYHVVTGSGTDSTAILDGFTITKGNADGSYPYFTGGGVYNENGSPTLTNCKFTDNSAISGGGGMYNEYSSPAVTNCAFTGNSSYYGSGICNSSGSPTVTNCIFSGNSSYYDGGGMYNEYCSPTVTNCTFTGNSAQYGGGIYNFCSSPIVTNCILWDNFYDQIYDDSSDSEVSYSDIQGGWAGTGTDNIDTDPLFVDADGPDNIVGTEDDNLRLLPDSPCIDAGNNAAVPAGITTDLDGRGRFVDGDCKTTAIVDMGAYEYQPQPPSQASNPSPANLATDVNLYAILSWTANSGVTSHLVYFGTSSPGTYRGEQTSTSYDPPETLSYNTTYYWRVDEKKCRGTTTGIIWHFTTTKNYIYVDTDATGANNGSSWADAYKYLQDALTSAVTGSEIRVAQGTYRPDEDTAHPSGTNDRTATFQLESGVAIYGGYPHGGGNRDPNIYQTILSGDIGTTGSNSDNSYHVVTGSGTIGTAVLDGFCITDGNADCNGPNFNYRYGGGMYNENGNPTVINCTFSGNRAFYGGGGMYNYNSSPTVTNCIFTSNSANNSGGGMLNVYSSPMITDCTFERNVANESSSGGCGGGICNSGGSPIIANCTFNENSAIDWYMLDSGGGGIYHYSGDGLITNCTFSGNWANEGGGIYNDSDGLITNCTFIGNWVYAYSAISASPYYEPACGGGMYTEGGLITNCTFIGNDANDGGGMYNYGATITNCVFSGNLAYVDCALLPMFPGSYSLACGGGVYNSWGPIANCTFSGNSAYAYGECQDWCCPIACGGGICNDSSPTIANCILWGNSAITGPQIYGSATVSFSDVQGGYSGAGNINADPCFVNAGNNDFHLDFNSPCIDAGDNTAVSVKVGVDLDGHPRFIDDPETDDTGNGTPPIVDMGAYEYRLGPNICKVSLDVGDCVEPGQEVNYRIDYNYPNWNQPDINDVNIIDYLPGEVDFNSASVGGVYDSNSRTVTWYIGILHPGDSGFITLKVKVKGSVSQCGSIRNKCALRSGEKILSSTSEYTAVCVKNSIVVENFDEYALPASAADLETVWKDYWTQSDPLTCAVVWPAAAPNRGGPPSWSMRYEFWNHLSPYYSEVRADVNTARPNGLGMNQDWLGMGAKTLVLWFFGLPINPPDEEMYIKLTDDSNVTGKVIYNGDMNDIREPEWHEWNIDLQDFVDDNNMNLANVKTITIGFGDRASDGVVWFEDIQLCECICVLSKRSTDFAKVDYAPSGNPAGDCVIDYQEVEVMANDWLMASPPADPNVDVYDDGMIDFKDFAVLAKMWLEEELWP